MGGSFVAERVEKWADKSNDVASSKCRGVRNARKDRNDYVNQPMPFSYVSLMNFSIYFYLVIFTVSLGFGNEIDPDTVYAIRPSILEFAILLFFSILMLGLKYLADRLQDPFGNDIEDLTVTDFVGSCADKSYEMLMMRFPDEVILESESESE